ncbi:MAG: transglycosylase SLT domain-containing protein [Candidatus Binatia bacterium]|nr:transglycosylase SLT domain-containing protein [Candidatus Binatia bacterium]
MWRLGLLALAIASVGCQWTGALRWSDPRVVWLRWQGEEVKQQEFRSAWQAWQKKREREAYSAFLRLAYAYPELADHSWFHAGLAAERLGRRGDAKRAMARVAEDYPASVFFAEAATLLAEWNEEAGACERAQGWAWRVQSSASAPELRQRAALVLARCDERAGNYAAAARSYREVWEQARVAGVRERARRYLSALRTTFPTLQPAAGDALAEAEWALRDRDWQLARALAEPLAKSADAEVAARAVLLLAEVAYGLGQWEDALRGWWAVARRFPDTRTAPAALFRMGSVLWNRNRDAAADRVFAELVRRYPASDQAPKALVARARIAYTSGDFDRARTRLKEGERLVLNPDARREIRWWEGWIAYRSGDFAAAASHFEALGADDERGRYWLARAREALGEERRAHQLYRQLAGGRPRYYAYLAERRLRGQGSLPFRLAGLSVPPPAELVAEAPAGANPFHLLRWRHLLAVGVEGLARKELRAVTGDAVPSDPAWRQFLIAAWSKTNAWADALWAVGYWRDFTGEERQCIEYPLAFYPLVAEAARIQRLDPLLVWAVMRQESLFDPQVCSSAGACGLMQLLPSTAAQVAGAVGLSPEAIDLFDPAQNIALGARYLRELLDRFADDPLLAMAAYNGGEEAARRWAARTRGQPPDEFVEEITYRETRDYVKRVWTHYLRYQAVYRRGV